MLNDWFMLHDSSDMTHLFERRISFMCERHDSYKPWLIYIWRHYSFILRDSWDMTHLYERHISFMCERHDSHETWLIYMWRHILFMCESHGSCVLSVCTRRRFFLTMRHDSFICETWCIKFAWVHGLICETWLIHMWDMTHLCVRHDSIICEGGIFYCVRWLKRMWDMTHLYVRRDSFM